MAGDSHGDTMLRYWLSNQKWLNIPILHFPCSPPRSPVHQKMRLRNTSLAVKQKRFK